MTREQIDDVAKAARVAAIGQAVQHGNRCVFAIVVCGLDVGAPMAVQSNLAEGKNEDIARILQNGLRALQNSPTGTTGGGGLILLSAVLLWLAAMFVASCGEVTNATIDGTAGESGISGAGAAGGAGGAVSAGVAGGGAAGGLGAAGATGGAADGGVSGESGDSGGVLGAGGAGGIGGVTGAAGGGGLTGAAGAGPDAGKTCAQRGAVCYQCPAPASTCAVANHGAWTCCDQAGLPSCDPTWCRQ